MLRDLHAILVMPLGITSFPCLNFYQAWQTDFAKHQQEWCNQRHEYFLFLIELSYTEK